MGVAASLTLATLQALSVYSGLHVSVSPQVQQDAWEALKQRYAMPDDLGQYAVSVEAEGQGIPVYSSNGDRVTDSSGVGLFIGGGSNLVVEKLISPADPSGRLAADVRVFTNADGIRQDFKGNYRIYFNSDGTPDGAGRVDAQYSNFAGYALDSGGKLTGISSIDLEADGTFVGYTQALGAPVERIPLLKMGDALLKPGVAPSFMVKIDRPIDIFDVGGGPLVSGYSIPAQDALCYFKMEGGGITNKAGYVCAVKGPSSIVQDELVLIYSDQLAANSILTTPGAASDVMKYMSPLSPRATRAVQPAETPASGGVTITTVDPGTTTDQKPAAAPSVQQQGEGPQIVQQTTYGNELRFTAPENYRPGTIPNTDPTAVAPQRIIIHWSALELSREVQYDRSLWGTEKPSQATWDYSKHGFEPDPSTWSAETVYSYFANDTDGRGKYASTFTVGADKVIQMLKTYDGLVETSNSASGYPDSINIEMDGEYFRYDPSGGATHISQAEIDNAVNLTVQLLRQYNLPLSAVEGHFQDDPSDMKIDPGAEFMQYFIQRVAQKMQEGTAAAQQQTATVPAPTPQHDNSAIYNMQNDPACRPGAYNDPNAVLNNFRIVDNGVTFGGAPDDNELNCLQKYGFSTVIDLANVPGERERVESRGMTYLSYPMNADTPLQADFAQTVDDLIWKLDDAAAGRSGSVLIHCMNGAHRANMMMGIYLEQRKGLGNAQAMDEVHKYAGLPIETYPNLVAAIQEYAPGGADSVPMKAAPAPAAIAPAQSSYSNPSFDSLCAAQGLQGIVPGMCQGDVSTGTGSAHVVQVDMRNPRIQMRISDPNSDGTFQPRTAAQVYAEPSADGFVKVAVVNADFYDGTGSGMDRTISPFVYNGQLYVGSKTGQYDRQECIVEGNGPGDVKGPVPSTDLEAGRYPDALYAVCGFPTILDNGQITQQAYDVGNSVGTRPKTLVGYNPDTGILTIALTTDTSLPDGASFLGRIGAKWALEEDGGSSTQGDINGATYGSSKAVASHIIIGYMQGP